MIRASRLITSIRLNGFIVFLSLFTALIADLPIKSSASFGAIEFTVLQNGESNRRFVWLHGDEKTAKKALTQHIGRYKGTAFLIRNHERLVRINGLSLDPNRIFTTDGTRKTLLKYHPQAPSQEIEKIVEYLNRRRGSFMEKLSPPLNGIMVAVHNNSRGYSIDSEIEDASDYSIKPDQDRRDFFLCTDRKDYDILVRSPFNALLQLNGVTKYHGSLSEPMGRQGQRYVNVEVRLGQLDKQKKMLEYLEQYLP